MKTILITGINGFLGSSLAKALSSKYNIIGLEYSLKNLYRINSFSYRVYSVENGLPAEIFQEQKIDIIIHTATFYGKNEDVMQMIRANFYLPVELLNQAIQNKCPLFINTDTVLDRNTNIYSLTKAQFKEWLFMRRNEIKGINMQLEHLYGPGASNTNFIIAMTNRLILNEPNIDLTLGEQRRDFIYIDDVVDAYLEVIEVEHDIQSDYSTFQVCSGELTSIKSLMGKLKKATKSTTHLSFGAIPYRENELMISESNNSSLTALGWTPKYTIKEGLKKTIK